MLPTAKALHYPAHPHQNAPPWQMNILCSCFNKMEKLKHGN